MSGFTEQWLAQRNREVLGIGVEPPAAATEDLPKDLRPEWFFEAEATRLLEEDGWRALRTDPVSDRGKGKGFGEVGMADHLYLRYDAMRANVLWVEFKSAKGKPKKHQLDWHAKERARGALTLIAGVDFTASIAGFTDWYAKSGLKRRA